MYWLYDITRYPGACPNGWRQNPMCFDTPDELLDFWAAKIGRDYSLLNVTGKDTYPVPERVPIPFARELPFYRYVYSQVPRPYLVTDNAGRHVDVRALGLPRTMPRDRSGGWWFRRSGSRPHRHRVTGPSMFRGTYRQACAADYDGIAVPGVRKKSYIPASETYDFCDDKWNRVPSRSWKDQTRAGRQYNRHHADVHDVPSYDAGAIWRNLAEDGFPVDPRLLDDAA